MNKGEFWDGMVDVDDEFMDDGFMIWNCDFDELLLLWWVWVLFVELESDEFIEGKGWRLRFELLFGVGGGVRVWFSGDVWNDWNCEFKVKGGSGVWLVIEGDW